jgi:hypothetical protein
MFEINELLQASYVNSRPYGTSSGNLRVYIPSLMPQISMGDPKSTPIALNSSCYINATDCKPTIASKINTQNFVTAIQSYNSYRQPYYSYGSPLKVVSKSKDCLTCKLSPEDEDNSIQLY